MIKRKILFITLDSPYLDRRILLFAKKLQDNGYQVKILSLDTKPEKGFETIKIINLVTTNKEVSILWFLKTMIKKCAPPLLWHFPPPYYRRNLLLILLAVPAFAWNRIFAVLRDRIFKSLYRRFITRNTYTPFYEEMRRQAKNIKADIYFAIDLITLPIGYYAASVNRAFLIYDAHEFYTGQVGLDKKQKKELQQTERKLIKYADKIITVNQDIADIFKKTYGQTNINVILNTPESSLVEKKSLHSLVNIRPGKKIVIYQGGFSRNRNLNVLVKIAERLDEGNVLVMLGWGEKEDELKRAALAAGILNQKIFFISKIPQTELLSYTATAALGIIPYPPVDINTIYCTPNKLFEFIQAGVPIVANEGLVTVKKFLNEYRIGITTDMTNPKESAQKIDNLLTDQAKIGFFKNNLNAARRELNWETESEKLLKIVDELSVEKQS